MRLVLAVFLGVDIPFAANSTADLQQLIGIVTLAIEGSLKDDPYLDHSRSIRVICDEIEADGAQLEAQIFYRSDQSRDQLSTTVLKLVNGLLREHNALPSMAISLKERLN